MDTSVMFVKGTSRLSLVSMSGGDSLCPAMQMEFNV